MASMSPADGSDAASVAQLLHAVQNLFVWLFKGNQSALVSPVWMILDTIHWIDRLKRRLQNKLAANELP